MSMTLIDTDAAPWCPFPEWTVKEHRPRGAWEWNPKQIHLKPHPRTKLPLTGHTLVERFSEMMPLNANVLDYLWKNPHLIPKSWEGRVVYFWGTIYSGPGGLLHVRCLNKYESKWGWSNNNLDARWDQRFTAPRFSHVAFTSP